MGFSSETFYEQLPGFSAFEDFYRVKWYVPLPADWFVVITDVAGSTRAIKAGRYKDVNSLGVASIVGLLNAVKPLQIPYVFGGDGATFCIPPSCRPAVEAALVGTRQMAKESFDLELRIGMVPMARLQGDGYRVLVGKFQPSSQYHQAMFLGDGLGYAEELIKSPAADNPFLISDENIVPSVSFAGFECRWDEVPSPHGETVSLLVQAMAADNFTRKVTYKMILDQIFQIYGPEATHHPLRKDRLSLVASLRKLSQEIRIRSAFQTRWARWKYALRLKLLVHAGRWMMLRKTLTENGDWGRYKENLILNSDYRKFDGLLRMVISGTQSQRGDLLSVLRQFQQQGKIAFGIHTSSTALVTCVISDYKTDHVHFLDGSNGGYALAAVELKRQLKGMRS